MPIDLSAAEFYDPNGTDLPQGSIILGGIGILKYLNPGGAVVFQIIETPQSEVNIAEQLGMAAMLDSYMGARIDGIYGDID